MYQLGFDNQMLVNVDSQVAIKAPSIRLDAQGFEFGLCASIARVIVIV